MRRKPRGIFRTDDHPELGTMATGELVALQADIGSYLGAVATRSRYLQNKREYIASLIRAREKPALTASDHAIVRWMQRLNGFDIEALRQQIIEAATIAMNSGAPVLRAKGDAQAFVHGGFVFVITGDRNIVTLYPDDGESE